MNSAATFYVHTCYGPDIPEVVLRSVQENHEIKHIFELNVLLEENIAGKAVSDRMDLTITMGDYEAPVTLKLPRGFQSDQKYPLLVEVYGGPGSQKTDQKWKIGYEDYLTSNYGIVHAIIDGRGTGYLSNEYKFEVFHKLGTVEMEDQITGTVSKNL